MNQKAAVIGAGIGGLAAALRLSKLGYQVTVFESTTKAGGKINEFCHQGFRFDMGPSLFTLPGMVDELFALFGKKSGDYIQYHQLPLIKKYFYEDGLTLNAWGDPQRFAAEIEAKTHDSALKVLQYLQHAREVYALTANNFIFNPFTFSTAFTREFWRAALRIRKLNVSKTMHQLNAASFRDPRVVQLFDRYATYNGSDPYQTPGTLAVIAHLEHNTGAYFPEKGMYQIVEGLFTLAQEQGIIFHFNEQVEQIKYRNKRVDAVQTAKKTYSFDLAVSDADIFTVYEKLLPSKKIPAAQRKQERSSSALIFYWGIKQRHSELDVHNILFSADYKREFEQLFSGKELPADPTVYIFISAKTVPGDAPAGYENWFVMVNAPSDAGQDWEHSIALARQRIISKINRILGGDIEKEILFERHLEPLTIEQNTGSYKGALYGNSSNNRFAAFQRHKNKTPYFDNLYFVGGSVHPGGGIPLCLSSARMMAEIVKKNKSHEHGKI